MERTEGQMAVRECRATLIAVLVGGLIAPCTAMADAIVSLTGPTSNAGAIDLTTAGSSYGGLVTVGSTTGYSLWGLLGGADASSPTSPIYGSITTSTPAGDNGKNAILRYYVLATSSSGSQSLISLGEIDPRFSGNASPQLVTVSGGAASLDFTLPGAAGRDLTNLASLQLLSVPALSGSGGQSTSVALAGNVTFPGSYTFKGADPNNVAPITETVSGHTYTGPPLFALIDPSDPNILNQYVITAGTDGYEVLLSLAELDPLYGASTASNQIDIVPYADSNAMSDFPGSGIARTILPGDSAFAHGRWESNLDLIEVAAVPEPPSAALLISGVFGLALVGLRRRRQ
jgi:hypothetical protein